MKRYALDWKQNILLDLINRNMRENEIDEHIKSNNRQRRQVILKTTEVKKNKEYKKQIDFQVKHKKDLNESAEWNKDSEGMTMKTFSSLSGNMKSSVLSDTNFQCLSTGLLLWSARALVVSASFHRDQVEPEAVSIAWQLHATEVRGHRLVLSNSWMW